MNYNPETEFQEILRRSKKIQIKKERRTVRMLAASSAATFVLLVLSIGILCDNGIREESRSVFGSFLLPTNAGGYVIAAVAAFFVGVLVTYIIIRKRRNTKAGENRQESKEVLPR